MKLTTKQLKIELSKILPQFSWGTQTIQTASGNFIRFKNLINLKQALTKVIDLELFDDMIPHQILTTGLMGQPGDVLEITQTDGDSLEKDLVEFNNFLHKIYDVFLSTVPDEDPNSINIKLPPFVSDFGDLEKVSHDLHLALSQLVHHEEIGGQEKIMSVENGSIWFNVLVGEAAIIIIGKIIWSATVIYKNMQQGKLLEQHVKLMKVKEESMRDILEAQKGYTKTMIEAEAAHIQTEHFKEHAPENLERIKNSIKIFAELIEKGAEIHPALIAPESVANLFPKSGNLLSVESKVKRIGNGEEKAPEE